MPFSSFSLNPFPDRKKPTSTEPSAADDELAAVKAAAWAWYQHGSGSESKPMREFGVTRPITVPKPSRYRLEATRSSSLLIQDNSQSPNPHNSLLDSYEIASISKRLSDLLDPTDRNNFRERSFESEIMDLGRQIEGNTKKPNKFRALWRWRRRRPSLMCGKMEDVVLGTLVPSPQKQPRHPMPPVDLRPP